MAYLTFQNPEFFALLVLIPILLLAHRIFYKITKKHAIIFSNFKTLKRVRKNTRMRMHVIMFFVRILVFCLLILVLTTPIIHYTAEKQPTDYIIALDTSASMTATDFQPNRFEAAQNFAQEFVDEYQGQTQMGVVGFSGYPFVALALSNDTQQIRSAITDLRLQTISGTDIAGAMITSTNLLLATNNGRAAILITDGSATTGQSNTDPIAQALSYVREHQVTIHAIGIGQEQSSAAGYLPTLYNVSAAYDVEQLQRITNETNGMFIQAQNQEELQAALQNLREESQSTNTTYNPQMILLLIILALIFIEWAFTNSRLRIIP